MEITPTFSIIIPAYNCEKTLSRALDSVISQSFNEWEVVVVDDGSSDKTLDVAVEYSKKDTRIKVHHKVNEGVSAARNLGLENAVGKYICFLDADDELFGNALNVFNRTLNTDIDIVCAGYSTIDIEGTLTTYVKEDFEKILNRDEAIELMYISSPFPYLGYCWGKCFRSDIIKQFSLSFDESIYFNEDRLFVTQYISCCNSIKFISESLYLYYHNPNSAMSSLSKGFNPKFMTDLDGFIGMKKCILKAGTTNRNIELANKGIVSSYWRIQWMMNASSSNTIARFAGLHWKLLKNLPMAIYFEEVIMAFLKKKFVGK